MSPLLPVRTVTRAPLVQACGDVLCLPDESIEIKAARGAPRALRRKGLQIQIKGRCDRCVQA
ncbi:uncharacterized protein SOCEGT47_064170 [Sorangium cellulosum]|uniref:Uncharacterized protein n=1 Tax=Sorangium cellulosum TaxID=56 RepID=A0A4P2Q8G3_SORCE|nr:uncharacterized protein SOCEGT47_064170 [Sorangium cellulosum]